MVRHSIGRGLWFGAISFLVHGVSTTSLIAISSLDNDWSWQALRILNLIDLPILGVARWLSEFMMPAVLWTIDALGLNLAQGSLLFCALFSLVLGGLVYFLLGFTVALFTARRHSADDSR